MNNIDNLIAPPSAVSGNAGLGGGLLAAKRAEDEQRAAAIAAFKARKGQVATLADVAGVKAAPIERAKRNKVQKEAKERTSVAYGAEGANGYTIGARSHNLPTEAEKASAVSFTDARVMVAVTKAHETLSVGEVAIAAREAGSLDVNAMNVADVFGRFRAAAQTFSAVKKAVEAKGGLEAVTLAANGQVLVEVNDGAPALANNEKVLLEQYLSAKADLEDTRAAYNAIKGLVTDEGLSLKDSPSKACASA